MTEKEEEATQNLSENHKKDMGVEEVESSRTNTGSQLWTSIASLFRCCSSTSAEISGNENVAKEIKSNGEKKEKPPKKSSKLKGSSGGGSDDDDDTRLFHSEENLFGKQWFGYSRKPSKKDKSSGKKSVNLDDLRVEAKPTDNNIMKAKLVVKQKDKRAPSAQHMRRMISHDVFDNNSPQPIAEEEEHDEIQSKVNKSISDEKDNSAEVKKESKTEIEESPESSKQDEETSLISKEDSGGENTETKVETLKQKVVSERITNDDSMTVTTSETAKETSAITITTTENYDSKTKETKDLAKDGFSGEAIKDTASTDVTSNTMTSDDAVKDTSPSSDVNKSDNPNQQSTKESSIKESENIISPAVSVSAEQLTTRDEKLDSPTTGDSAESCSKATPEESVLSGDKNSSSSSQSELKSNDEIEASKEEILSAETSKDTDDESTEKIKDENTENKNQDKLEADSSEINHEREVTKSEENRRSPENQTTEEKIKAQDT